MKTILIILLTANTLLAADGLMKFYILPAERTANEDKLKAVTREIWGAAANSQLPGQWSTMTESQKVEWCYGKDLWLTNQVCAALSTTNADLYCVSKLQTANFMTSNKWNEVRNDLKPLEHGKDYMIEITDDE